MDDTSATSDLIGVLGATGQQGGAVIDALLDAGRRVRAIVRDPDSDKAQALRARGLEVVHGDQDEPRSLHEPLSGIGALFLMTTFAGEGGTEGEASRGIAVADAAVRAGVPRVVFSSVGGAERDTGIPHFESKYRVEQHLTSVLPTVVVRPVFFMDNLADQLDGDGIDEFVLRLPMPGDVALQLVAVRDIGKVVAAALIDQGALGGDTLEIAGDELTGEQMAERIGLHLGRAARYQALPLDSLGDNEDAKAMFRWFAQLPAYDADLDRTRRVDPEILDLEAWLKTR